MPEGPEVTIVTEQLNNYIQSNGCILESIHIESGRYLKKPLEGLDLLYFPATINSVKNKGKFIYWHITNPPISKDCYIFSTLGMSGGYLPYRDNYVRVSFNFSDYSIFYTDIRSFGTLKIVKGHNFLEKKLGELGPDMLNNPCSEIEWLAIMEKYQKKSIVSFLMEQKAISGVGNIYKSESLYHAKIDPRKKVAELLLEQKLRLRESVIGTLRTAYLAGGSTIRSYKDFYGEKGNFTKGDPVKILSEKFPRSVYNKKMDSLGNKIEKLHLDDDRTTYWVPEIQQ